MPSIHPRTLSFLASFAAALLTPGCSLFFEADGPSCQTRSDCAPEAGEVRLCNDGRCVSKDALQWGCAVAPQRDLSGSIPLTIIVTERVSRRPQPMADLTFRLCTLEGRSRCENPVFLTTDSDGIAHTEILRKNSYFVEVMHPNPSLASMIAHVGPTRPNFAAQALEVELESWLDYTPNSVTVPDLSPDLAHVYFNLSACPGWDADNSVVSVAEFDGIVEGPFYRLESGLAGDSVTATDGTGEGAFLNIDAAIPDSDLVPMRLRVEDGHTGVPLAAGTVLVQRGFVTQVKLDPLANFPD